MPDMLVCYCNIVVSGQQKESVVFTHMTNLNQLNTTLWPLCRVDTLSPVLCQFPLCVHIPQCSNNMAPPSRYSANITLDWTQSAQVGEHSLSPRPTLRNLSGYSNKSLSFGLFSGDSFRFRETCFLPFRNHLWFLSSPLSITVPHAHESVQRGIITCLVCSPSLCPFPSQCEIQPSAMYWKRKWSGIKWGFRQGFSMHLGLQLFIYWIKSQTGSYWPLWCPGDIDDDGQSPLDSG